MSKKIGILTSAQSFGDNYGAVLQAYALSTILKSINYEPQIIRYKVEGEYVNHGAPIKERLKNTVFNSEMSLHAKKTLFVNKLLHKSVNGVFNSFVDRHLDFYNENFIGYDELNKNPPDFSAFITGSDQVWNPVIHANKNDPGYFLDFVPDGVKRIAYAPSIGVDKIPEECEKTLGGFLEKFDALSVREKSGADIIKNCCDLDVPIMLDPTLLLTADDWNQIAKKPDDLPEKYVFCYKFGKSKTMDETIKFISQKYNMPVITAPSSPEVKFKADYSIGPAEFLGAIKNATIVCADSFHATAFSIIHKKPFLIFPRHLGEGMNMNSRMKNILELFGFDDRYISENATFNKEKLFEISFENADKVLEEKRRESKNYLINALKNV